MPPSSSPLAFGALEMVVVAAGIISWWSIIKGRQRQTFPCNWPTRMSKVTLHDVVRPVGGSFTLSNMTWLVSRGGHDSHGRPTGDVRVDGKRDV